MTARNLDLKGGKLVNQADGVDPSDGATIGQLKASLGVAPADTPLLVDGTPPAALTGARNIQDLLATLLFALQANNGTSPPITVEVIYDTGADFDVDALLLRARDTGAAQAGLGPALRMEVQVGTGRASTVVQAARIAGTLNDVAVNHRSGWLVLSTSDSDGTLRARALVGYLPSADKRGLFLTQRSDGIYRYQIGGHLEIGGLEATVGVMLIAGNATRWLVDPATGALIAQGGDKLIQNVADPVSDQDAATRKFVLLQRGSTVVKSGSYVITDSDGYGLILVDASGGAVDITLPGAVANLNRLLTIKKVDSSANVVTIKVAAGEYLDDTLNWTWPLGYEDAALTVRSAGTAFNSHAGWMTQNEQFRTEYNGAVAGLALALAAAIKHSTATLTITSGNTSYKDTRPGGWTTTGNVWAMIVEGASGSPPTLSNTVAVSNAKIISGGPDAGKLWIELTGDPGANGAKLVAWQDGA